MKHKDEKNSLPILFFPANHNRKEKEAKQIKDCDGFRVDSKNVENSLLSWEKKEETVSCVGGHVYRADKSVSFDPGKFINQ